MPQGEQSIARTTQSALADSLLHRPIPI